MIAEANTKGFVRLSLLMVQKQHLAHGTTSGYNGVSQPLIANECVAACVYTNSSNGASVSSPSGGQLGTLGQRKPRCSAPFLGQAASLFVQDGIYRQSPPEGCFRQNEFLEVFSLSASPN